MYLTLFGMGTKKKIRILRASLTSLDKLGRIWKQSWKKLQRMVENYAKIQLKKSPIQKSQWDIKVCQIGLRICPKYPKYSKHWPYTVADTIDCVCSKMLNHGLNHGYFLSLFKLIPCPIHWIVCVLAYLNFTRNQDLRSWF